MFVSQDKINEASAGFQAVYMSAFEGKETNLSMLAMEMTSTDATETHNFLTGVPMMKEMVGEANLQDIAAAGFTLANKEFDVTIPVKLLTIHRDKTGIMRHLFQDMGTNARVHPYLLVTALLSAGFTAKDYTGKNFYDENKKYDPADSSKGARTFTNKSTAALSADAFKAGRTALRKMVDAKGNNLQLGDKLLLVVGPALEDTAKKLRDNEYISIANGSTENNTLRNTFDVLVVNELATDTEWHLMETGKAAKPFLSQTEIPTSFLIGDDPKSDHMMKRKEVWYQAYGVYNAGYALPQLAYGSTGLG